MNQKVYSLRRHLLAGWAITSGLLLTVFFIYGIYSLLQTRRDRTESNRIMANHYAIQLNKDIDSMKGYVERIYSENIQYQSLRRRYLTEADWYKAMYYLSNSLEEKAGTLDFFGGIFVYDEDKQSMRSQFSDYEHSGDSYRLNLCLKDYMKGVTLSSSHEGFFRYANETYAVYIRGARGKLVGFIINISRYFSPEESIGLIYYNENGITEKAGIIPSEKEFGKLLDTKQHSWNGMGYVISSEPLNFSGLRLAVIQKNGGLEELLGDWEFWLLSILIPLILIIVMWEIQRMFNRALILPVEHFVDRITDMKKDQSSGIKTESLNQPIREFMEINTRLDQMIDEIELLQKEKYEKELETHAALLQYYQLQVNPHFFINCLNIVDSLLEDKNSNIARSMIRWLSDHFRYVFQNRKNQVTVREELNEVEAYCNIYDAGVKT